MDVNAELAKISEEVEYNRGFLLTVMKKLENERFVQNAPHSFWDWNRRKKAMLNQK